MIKYLFLLAACGALLVVAGCKNNSSSGKSSPEKKPKDSAEIAYSPEAVENAVIYEVNIRQYSPEGSFDAFTKDIPELKKLGVKVLWVMPIQPISMKRRKATDDKSIEDIKNPEEKEKYLGSYYAITDYTAVNKDYGSLEDFKELVNTAHDHGMLVILDWVANHTGWDHKWIEEHPEFYHKNKKEEITDPLNPETDEPWGWTDVAHLDYANDSLHQVMKDEMLYWVEETNIDGFRCDVADNVPLDFWEFTSAELQEEKPVFMLMEAYTPEYMSVFDMAYNWPGHHMMNDIAQGKKNVTDLDELIREQDSLFPEEAILMNFTSNHDENSWNGTEYERLGDAVETFAALTYTLPGMPLIYNGQEYDFNQRLKFFEKDSITHQKGKMFPIYEKLGKLKNENPALNGGINKASYKRLKTSDDKHILAFKREKDGKSLYYIANLTDTEKNIELPIEGSFQNYMKNQSVNLKTGKKVTLKPWEYWILVEAGEFELESEPELELE